MKLLKSLSQTFVPFLILLIFIIITIIYFDALAEELSNEPQLIEISTFQVNRDSENFWEFESEIDDTNHDFSWRSDSIYINGKKYYDNNEWDKAESHFLSLTNSYSNSPQLLNLLGLVQYKKRDYTKAISTFNKCISLKPNYSAALANLAILYVKINRHDDAESIYQKAISLNPNNPKPYLNLGILYCKNQEWSKVNYHLLHAKGLASGSTKSKILYYSGLAYLNLNDTIKAQKDLEEAILLKPDYIPPRVQLALTAKNFETQIEGLNKVILLNPNYADAYYHLAVIYQKKGDKSKVESNLKIAVKLNPKNTDIQTFLAEYYLANNNTLEAEAIFRQLKQYDGKLPQNYFNMGKVESKKGNYQQAISFYDSALMMTSDDYPEAHLNKGLILRKIGEVEKAINAYGKAIEFDKNYIEAYYNLAIANQKLKRDNKAIKSYRRALQIDDSYIKAWYNLGVIYNRKDNLDSAALCYQKAIEYDPDYLKALMNLGIVFNKQNKPNQAIKCYNTAIGFYPNYSSLWFNLAIAYKNGGDNNLAISAYEKVLSLEPNDGKARKNIGVLYARIGEIEKAIQVYQEAIDLNASDYELRYNLGLQFIENRQITEAISQLSKAVQLNPQYRKGYNKLYEIYFEINDLNKASNIMEEMLTYIPDKNKAYKMGRVLHNAKKYKEALVWYDKSIALGKDTHWVFYWKGLAFRELNDIDSAINLLKQAAKIYPKSKFAHLRLGETFEKQNKNDEANYHYKKVFEIDPEFARSKNIAEKITQKN